MRGSVCGDYVFKVPGIPLGRHEMQIFAIAIAIATSNEFRFISFVSLFSVFNEPNH